MKQESPSYHFHQVHCWVCVCVLVGGGGYVGQHQKSQMIAMKCLSLSDGGSFSFSRRTSFQVQVQIAGPTFQPPRGSSSDMWTPGWNLDFISSVYQTQALALAQTCQSVLLCAFHSSYPLKHLHGWVTHCQEWVSTLPHWTRSHINICLQRKPNAKIRWINA